MRNFCAVLVAAGLVTAPMASAQPSATGSLAPGKPAGVHAAQDFETVLTQLRQLIDVDLSRLEKQLEAAGAPWTPGRVPEWKDQ